MRGSLHLVGLRCLENLRLRLRCLENAGRVALSADDGRADGCGGRCLENAGRVASSADDGRADGCGSLTTAASPWHVLASSRLRATPSSFVFVLIVPSAAREPRGPSACVPRHRPSRRPGGIISAPLPAGREDFRDGQRRDSTVVGASLASACSAVRATGRRDELRPFTGPFLLRQEQGADDAPRATRGPMARDAGGGAPVARAEPQPRSGARHRAASGSVARSRDAASTCNGEDPPSRGTHSRRPPVVRRRCHSPCVLQTTRETTPRITRETTPRMTRETARGEG